MPIDIQTERLMSLRELAAWIRSHMGTRTGYQCVHGWATRGRRFRGRVVKLEAVAGPGGLRSSLEALERFSAELTALRLGLPAKEPARGMRERRRAIREAEEYLRRNGFRLKGEP